ncbi:AAA family ATPase [Mycolicibacterium houstonense]|uniref:AAA family ATPase n=1 Tax=Mycolicibacterium houstonense TaxID=146021 RepID=UPI00082DF41D|nr:AAA family ATPase [Mycolicibacterium houstonense]
MVASAADKNGGESAWRFEFDALPGEHGYRLRLVSSGSGDTALSIPDVTGLSPLEAALAYAAAGGYVLPVKAGKHPGSIVGTGWPQKSSRDPARIRQWWTEYPDAGIALHTGRSGLTACDLDVDVIPDELAWLKGGLFQATRGKRGARGHYVFASTETFTSGALRTEDGTQVGEIRSGNTVIMVAPSPHPKAEHGGEYRWITTGPVPDVPDEGRAALTAKAGGCGEPITAEVEAAWCTAHTEEREPWRRTVLRESYAAKLASGERHHPAMMATVGWAAREIVPGLVSSTIFDDLHDDWLTSFKGSDRRPAPGEFWKMVRQAIAAVAPADHDAQAMTDLLNRARREFGTRHDDDINSAPSLDAVNALLDRPDTSDDSNGNAVKSDDEKPRRNAPLDLRRLRTEPSEPVAWLLPDVLARDSYVSLSSAPGTGKSIFARGIAVDAALGRAHTEPSETFDPAKVIYLDAENGEDWWRGGLDAMGAPLDLPNLSVVCFPDLAGLDTPKGSREFLTLVSDLARDLDGELDLVVLDTVSRFIDGGENDADTWSQFYRRAVQPLRERKVTVLRLDHLGKDADRGPRGSSHKLSDVDADYRLTADKPGGDDLTLTLGKRRRQHFAETVSLRRLDGPLRHEPGASTLALGVTLASGQVVPADRKVAALVAELDRLGIGVALGRPKSQAAVSAAGGSVQASNAVWTAALKFRRDRAAHAAQNGGQQT